MNNPYDIYNDNRAYHGYERCREEVIEYVNTLRANSSNGRVLEVLEVLLEGIENEHV